VTIAWKDLSPPAFGDTLNLTKLATTKLQALDFGVSSAATKFELDLDEIYLF
jgi:hypothetical protein